MIRFLRHLGLAFALLLGSMQFAFAVDVNTADAAALDSVKDIGPATASKIIEERSKNGPFKDWDDLITRVKGVGPKNSDTMSAGGLTVNGKSKPNAPATKTESAPSASKTAKEAKEAPAAKDASAGAKAEEAPGDKKDAKKKRKSKKEEKAEKAGEAGADAKSEAGSATKAGARKDEAAGDKKDAKKKRKSKKDKAAEADAKPDGGTPSDTKPAK